MATLDETRVLITAGASGIGYAMAEAFTEAGASVWVTDVDPDAIAGCPNSWRTSQVDAADEGGGESAFRRNRKHLGRTRYLVCKCRHCRTNRVGRRHRALRLATVRFGQSGRRVSRQQIHHSDDEAATRRRHCHNLFNRWIYRLSAASPLRGSQMGRDRTCQDARDGAGAPQYPCQRDLPRPHRRGAYGWGHQTRSSRQGCE